MVSTSARNPNESYAERAKKASTLATQQKQPQQASHAPPAPPSSSLKPPPVNVWAERIKEQQAHAGPQRAQMPRQRAASSPQPPRDDAIQPRSPPPDVTVQLALLDQRDEHDPFVVRVPPHLSRRSSSSTNPLPTTDPNAWPLLPGTGPHSNASSAGYDSPFLSAAPSRQNSTASFRHHACSPSGSARFPRVQSSFSQRSHSASQSRAQSRSGSSASSPRLQIRGRALPQDDSLPPDLRLDHPHRRSSNTRSSPALPDPPNHISRSFQIDPVPSPADLSYYCPPPVPSSQDMPPRYTHNFVPQYALHPHFSPAHVPGHTSPPYIPPHSGQHTPPYPHYPPYPAYMYGHPPFFWGDIPPQSHNHFQNQPSIPPNHASPSDHANASEHAVPHEIEFSSISPAITTESSASEHLAQSHNGLPPRPSKSVVFGTINPAESQDDPSASPPNEEQHTDTTVERTTEQFAAFSIGVSPDEPGPSRLASRKSSVKSLSKVLSSQPTANNGTEDATTTSPLSQEVNGTTKSIKWEFGTTLSEHVDDPRPPSSPPPSVPPPNHQSEFGAESADDQPDPDLPDVSPSHDSSQADRSMDQSETGSQSAGDVWVVKDYGYGFGDHSGSGIAPDVVRWEMREREKERVRENRREQEMLREHYHDRGWVTARQPGWRHENGVEEARESWEQLGRIDVPRHLRPRRGSFSGYGGYERGGFAARRGGGFGGRFQGGRGRGGFFHHQRPASYPYVPLPQPPPLPFEVLPPAIDMVNGYGSYGLREFESYEAVLPASQPRVPSTPATYSVDAMKNCLLGQLEYYLSPQNMAQDLYLRQRMDNKGWIPISLLASFKRVRQLHTDANIVREVLSRSTVVEVSGDWARMGKRQWEVFVLPNAPRSVVTGVDRGEGKSPRRGPYYEDDAYAEPGETEGEHGDTDGDCDGEDCEADDEDDDIEFVIGEEAEGSWMPVPERKQ